jgi:hypothetical protein
VVGICNLITEQLGSYPDSEAVPADAPLTVASFVASGSNDIYTEQFGFGQCLPDMPLFLDGDRYVNTPLETTYGTVYAGTPNYYRLLLERDG